MTGPGPLEAALQRGGRRPVSAKSSRKGKRGELEVVALARRLGFQARRTAPMQAGHARDFPDLDGLAPLWPEVKCYRCTPVNRFAREYVDFERPGWVPVLVWRDDRTPWRATLPLEELLKLLREVREARRTAGRDPWDGPEPLPAGKDLEAGPP